MRCLEKLIGAGDRTLLFLDKHVWTICGSGREFANFILGSGTILHAAASMEFNDSIIRYLWQNDVTLSKLCLVNFKATCDRRSWIIYRGVIDLRDSLLNSDFATDIHAIIFVMFVAFAVVWFVFELH